MIFVLSIITQKISDYITNHRRRKGVTAPNGLVSIANLPRSDLFNFHIHPILFGLKF